MKTQNLVRKTNFGVNYTKEFIKSTKILPLIEKKLQLFLKLMTKMIKKLQILMKILKKIQKKLMISLMMMILITSKMKRNLKMKQRKEEFWLNPKFLNAKLLMFLVQMYLQPILMMIVLLQMVLTQLEIVLTVKIMLPYKNQLLQQVQNLNQSQPQLMSIRLKELHKLGKV